MGFVQLHLHNHLGSRLDGVGDPKDYAKKAKEFGHKSLAVTDHGRLNAIYAHQKACIDEGVKPIIGVEMYVNEELVFMNDKGKRARNKNCHLVLLVKNEIGYKNLLKLNYLSVSDETHFYYSPRITAQEINEYKEGLMIGSACMANPFVSVLRETGDEAAAEELFVKYLDMFGDSFYTEIQFNEITNEIDNLKEGQKTANELMIGLANKHGVPIVMTGDVHYAEKGQDQLQTLAIAIRNRDTIDNISFELESKELFYHDTEDYKEFNKRWDYGLRDEDIDSYLAHTEVIAEQCNYEIPERTKMILPKVSSDDDALLIKKAQEGLKKKIGDTPPPEYQKRLAKELEILLRKGFASYCMILEDIYRFADGEGIYRGPSRGSGGGSLVLWSLDITTMDPIEHGLLFERFLNEKRCEDVVYDYFA